MRTYCKNVDPADPAILGAAVEKFLSGKTNRNTVARWMCGFFDHCGVRRMKRILADRTSEQRKHVIATVVDWLREKITSRTLVFTPIRVTQRKDRCSGKIRAIGTQSVEQSVMDHVAVICLKELFAKIGRNQMASIPGRGCLRGAQRVARWLEEDTTLRYFVKLDAKKCYESIKPEYVIDYVRRYVKNGDVLYVLETILANHTDGLSIGSYLSQWLCNLYMSRIYHFIEDSLHTYRRSKRIRYAGRFLFYMDDMLLISSNAKNLRKAVEAVREYAAAIGVTVTAKQGVRDMRKPSCRVEKRKADGRKRVHAIPMMGYRILPGRLLASKKIWTESKRAAAACLDKLEADAKVSLAQARLYFSRHGHVKYGTRPLQRRRMRVQYILTESSTTISSYAKSHLYRTAAAGGASLYVRTRVPC